MTPPAPNPILARLLDPKPSVSVEFFPPKTEEGARQILNTANALRAYDIAFASITYGAGGSTRERTIEYGDLLQKLCQYRVVPHLTCVGHSRAELAHIIGKLRATGFPGIMALRGDPPKGETSFRPTPDGLTHASELVSLIREHEHTLPGSPPTAIGVAGYPERHPEATSADEDLHWLAHKIAQGADFITTQLFFDNAYYFNFVKRCRAMGIAIPIIPGILPLVSLAQACKFSAFGGSCLPHALKVALDACGEDAETARRIGIDWAFAQISELIENGAPGFHLYILNRTDPALALLERLRTTGFCLT
jgi:methylenetetrahydrofolate reductase (NADPH)